MAIPVSFRWDEGFVKRIDEARGDVPRSAFVRRALEFWLEGPSERWRRAEREVAELYGLEPPGAVEQALGSSGRAGVRGRVPASAPAEQPPDTRAMDLLREDDPDPDFSHLGDVPVLQARAEAQPRVRSSSVARPFRPAPKQGKK